MIRTTWRTARTWHYCTGRAASDCQRRIEPGDRYVFQVAAPGHEDLGNEHWWQIKLCLTCCAYYDKADPAPLTHRYPDAEAVA